MYARKLFQLKGIKLRLDDESYNVTILNYDVTKINHEVIITIFTQISL